MLLEISYNTVNETSRSLGVLRDKVICCRKTKPPLSNAKKKWHKLVLHAASVTCEPENSEAPSKTNSQDLIKSLTNIDSVIDNITEEQKTCH